MEPGHFRVRKPLNNVWMRNLLKMRRPLEVYNERTCKLNVYEMVSQ
jgi:hypothetical protein